MEHIHLRLRLTRTEQHTCLQSSPRPDNGALSTVSSQQGKGLNMKYTFIKLHIVAWEGREDRSHGHINKESHNVCWYLSIAYSVGALFSECCIVSFHLYHNPLQ